MKCLRSNSTGHRASAGRHLAALLLAAIAACASQRASFADDIESPLRVSGTNALMRAQARQHVHDFPAALQDLDRVLAADPRNLQARLTRAAIHQVQGDYDAAAADCRSLALLATPLTTIDCLSRAMSHRGKARIAYEQLRSVRDRAKDVDPKQRREVEITLADIANRLGRPDDARTHYLNAMSVADVDSYTLVSYADFLLERRDYRTMLQLALAYPSRRELMLPAAIASRESNASDRIERVERVRQRYEERRYSSDAPTRDYARFLLDVEDDAQLALQAALTNWQTQREPADALILLRAAVAAGRPEATAPVREFVAKHGLEDRRIELLLQRARTS